ncbi:MAG TPA: fumarate/nitrate reduction transcriptional regulator Fnr [Gammaproteobacteria bacterium]|jgi:CRP/FNR family transcriptional regulator|nr:fumarate/nitrate reduction transcriptional regulator Fnr [Gammaproteobacteria bacterium]
MQTARLIRIDAAHPKARPLAACSSCSLANLCLSTGLGHDELEQMDGLVKRSEPMHEGDHLYRVGDRFDAVYAVRSGTFKTYTVDSEGREHVLGFHLPGELMGLKAIYPKQHITNAVALDTATVCVLPYAELTTLATHIPSIQSQLVRLMSRDLAEAVTLAGDYTAEERLAAFLIGLSRRYTQRGFSSSEFNLSMSRRDIANYLRLAPETVSRVFARFEKDGLISVDRRAVTLLDAERLHGIAQCMEDMQA